MEKLIINYEDWKKYHPIIRAALLHGELVKIHPFVDGNGRTSRLVMNLSLMNSGFLPVIVQKEKRLEYYNALDKAHTTGDYTDFIKLVNESIKVDTIKSLNLLSSFISYKFIQQSCWLFCVLFKLEIFSINGRIFSIKFSK